VRWFSNTRIGWGLRPSSWQGWALTIVSFAFIVVAARFLASSQPWGFATVVIVATALLLLVAYLTSRG
jgi:peptidoglycan/LPS O-acetylase OafA/YrhL